MKKLCIAGLITASLLAFSCTNDDKSYEIQGAKDNEVKSLPESILSNELNAKAKDSIKVIFRVEDTQGDPSIPRPPR